MCIYTYSEWSDKLLVFAMLVIYLTRKVTPTIMLKWKILLQRKQKVWQVLDSSSKDPFSNSMRGRSQTDERPESTSIHVEIRTDVTRWTLSESKSLFYILVLTSGRECLTKKEIPSQKQKTNKTPLFGKDSTSFLKTVHFDSPIIVPIWKWPNHETMTLKEESLFHPVIFPLRSQSLTDRVLALGSAELSETSKICSWKPQPWQDE